MEDKLDIELFRKRFPQFKDEIPFPDESIQVQYDMTPYYIDLSRSWFKCKGKVDLLRELLTAHLLDINGGGLIPKSSVAGNVTSASIGSVSVGVQITDKGTFLNWLGKTTYGEQIAVMLSGISAGGLYIGGSRERRGFRKNTGRF